MSRPSVSGRKPSTLAPGRLHRLVVGIALVALVVTAAVVDRPSTERVPQRIPDQSDIAQVGAATYARPSRTARDRSMPVSAPLGAASTTWFCGGAPADRSTIVLTNRAAYARQVIVTTVTADRHRAERRVGVPARATRDLSLDFAGATVVAAIVESRHGGVVAQQRIAGPDTQTTAACATVSSEEWFFAGGDTQRGASETLALFNPFDDLATADVTFLTPDGFRRPQATQGLAVPGRSVVLVDVGKVQNRRSNLGAAVTTRAGRLVAWRYQTFDGSGPAIGKGQPPKGVSLALGSATPLTRFALPTASTGEGVQPRLLIANPGATSATVQLTFAVDDPATNGQPPPTTIDLLSGAVQEIGTDQLQQIPPGVAFSVSGRVVDGGAVVAELWFDGAAPASGHGSFAAPAFGLAATGWVVPVGLGSPGLDQLGVASAGRTARLTAWVLADGRRARVPLAGQPGAVPAGGRITIDLTGVLEDHPGAALEVTASKPVTVSRLQTGPDDRGLVSAPAVPIAGGLADP